MIDKINDIAWQAHQGSVAAIIQVLNENLVTDSVRTRAVFVDDVLQILCEAATAEQLEQSILVAKIQHILESIAPRNIHRVNINTRIVREEQLLWLEEINRDRQNQLLWSQEITLSKPGLVQQIVQDLKDIYHELEKPLAPQSQYLLNLKEKQLISTKRLMIASLILCTIIAINGLGHTRVFKIIKNLIPSQLLLITKENEDPSKVTSPSTQNNNSQSTENISNHNFAEAVRIANQAANGGRTAITRTQWLELAAKWQRASDLMSKVSSTHPRYQEAQIRTKLYQEYSKTAQKEADKLTESN